MYYKKQIGKIGENLAVLFLEQNGYIILDRNFLCTQGEIDIVALDKSELVFIEVKTRTNMNYGYASEAVNKQKQKHLIKAIKYYLHSRNFENEFIRIDIIEIYIKGRKAHINHIKQAIN